MEPLRDVRPLYNRRTRCLQLCRAPLRPGGSGWGVAGWAVMGMLLLSDFYFTRGFALDMRDQLSRIEASVKAASDVAAALARYDVDVAEAAITSGSNLPTELARPFLALLSNLRSYKA
eukprot:Hpha_TRINITY_DN15801_c0_g1::TRINITY_DN15801_c0_g1_i1::g.188198::m.188198